MRLVRIRDPAGSTRSGEWTDDGIEVAGRTYDPSDVTILPSTDPTKIVCLGGNYRDHLIEDAKRSEDELPDRPPLFLKGPNAVAGHGATITLPSGKERIEQEAELGVVIGKQAKGVSRESAMDYVLGYTCVDDVSNRDDQFVEQNWIRGKAFDNAAPCGPVVATPDEVPEDATIEGRINGDVTQHSTIAHLIFSVPEIIEEVTTYLTLEPGDLVLTGTPQGPGQLSDGDVVEIEIEGIGTLEHTVRA